MTLPPDSLLSNREVAAALGIHPNTLKRLADQGRIAYYRITERGDRRYDPDDVARFMASRRVVRP